ncbi:hypothetical protein [Amycolatopsis sp. CA-230715]|uniref:hypothetical protein n=1 Tax=Amycolatopsis sp. CA-230715 TaxID=2745196 RepID=UPI001C334861|nr:hypothetical protein [Amycolatopsis sp. CA-230715]QWF82165.1 hypothetical protein HUW46_05602 [Amycolatopsis sp. CA-230715]
MRATSTAAFLPLTTQAAAGVRAREVLRMAQETESAAADCWAALLAGCEGAGRWGLDSRLRRLSEATSRHVGSRWWFAEGASHRLRVARAQAEVEDAIEEGDGSEFARAFVGYDHAMASAVVCAGSPGTEPAKPARPKTGTGGRHRRRT